MQGERSDVQPSYHTFDSRASTLERGGVEARKGFELQDHVAVGFLIDLLTTPGLLEVWCETHDDITLI